MSVGVILKRGESFEATFTNAAFVWSFLRVRLHVTRQQISGNKNNKVIHVYLIFFTTNFGRQKTCIFKFYRLLNLKILNVHADYWLMSGK